MLYLASETLSGLIPWRGSWRTKIWLRRRSPERDAESAMNSQQRIKVMHAITELETGGAEQLLVNTIRHADLAPVIQRLAR